LDERYHGRRDEGGAFGRDCPTTLFASSQGTGDGAFGVAIDSKSVYWTNQGNTAGLGPNGTVSKRTPK
jgi:hypothetical protein